jgi:hypothetical protein
VSIKIVDAGNVVYASRNGETQGVAWGPAADRSGDWFARWNGAAQGERVSGGKEAAVRWLELRSGQS